MHYFSSVGYGSNSQADTKTNLTPALPKKRLFPANKYFAICDSYKNFVYTVGGKQRQEGRKGATNIYSKFLFVLLRTITRYGLYELSLNRISSLISI